MKRKFLSICVTLGLLLALARADAERQPAAQSTPIAAAIDRVAIERVVRELGADDMAGRGTGSAGGERAAAYLAHAFERLGLHPGGDDGFLQRVPLHGSTPRGDSDLAIVSPCGFQRLALGADYLLLSNGQSTLIQTQTPVVFAGYGIVAPEYDYNDYLGLDVRGKVVACLTGEPPSDRAGFFAGTLPTPYATAESKRRTAIARGARACLLIPSPQTPRWLEWSWAQRQLAGEQLALPYAVPHQLALLLHPRAAGALFCGAKTPLEEVMARAQTHRMKSFPLAAGMWFRGSFTERDFRASNIVGVLPGADRSVRDTAVIVTAHYDHLGIGPEVAGDRIYNGVVDNALGVAGLLEIARVMAARPQPARTVVFVLTTGEEHGLLGASYYTEHPVVPLHLTIANVNIDGLAFADMFSDVMAFGGELSTLGAILAEVAERQGLAVAPLPAGVAALEAYSRSDQHAFAEAGVPSILVNEGLGWRRHTRAEALARTLWWGENIYHSPRDDLSQPLDFTAALQHCELLLAFIEELASPRPPPHWISGSPYAHIGLLSKARRR